MWFSKFSGQKNGVTEVHLTSVREDGTAFIQIVSDSLKFLHSLLAEANQMLLEYENSFFIRSPTDLVGGKVFLVKYAEDNQWHRAVIDTLTSNNEVIHYVLEILLKIQYHNLPKNSYNFC